MILIPYIFLALITFSIIYYFNFRNDMQEFKNLIRSVIIEIIFVGIFLYFYEWFFIFWDYIFNNK